MDRVNTKYQDGPTETVVMKTQAWWAEHRCFGLSCTSKRGWKSSSFNNSAIQSSTTQPFKVRSNIQGRAAAIFWGNFSSPAAFNSIQLCKQTQKDTTRQKSPPDVFTWSSERPPSPQMLPEEACHTEQPQQARPGVEEQKLGRLTGYRILFFKLESKKEIDRKISSARSRWL